MRFGYKGKISRPVLSRGLNDIWEAFLELNKGRQSGFDICRIELKDIIEYLRLWNFTGIELIEAVKHIRSLDLKAIELFREK